jgi:hypothetical protein
MNRLLVALIAGLTCTSIVAIGACGGSGDDSVGPGASDATIVDGATGDSGDTTGDSASDGGSITDTGTPTPDSGSCATDDGGCFKCCSAEDPDAAAALAADAIDCACTTPGDCQTACADTVCRHPAKAPDGKCSKCLVSADAGACLETAKTAACGSSVTCDDVVTCLQSCAK